ncbi:MAG: hypothetical protein ACOYXR_11960, partial [Nitrospirota bacterium]
MAPTTKSDPSNKMARLASKEYVTGSGVTIPITGCACATVKLALPLSPPADAGLVTVIVYVPGNNAVFGHQKLTRAELTNTNGTLAEAALPATVGPGVPLAGNVVLVVALLTSTVAPTTKSDPSTKIARLAVTPYVTGSGVTIPTTGCAFVTVKLVPPLCSPPAAAGLVTVIVYAPGARPVFAHHQLRRAMLTCTNGTLAVAALPATVV